MVERLPNDEQILAAVSRWGNHTMTYVVRNVLASGGFNVETPWVLRQLKRLEREGKVRRVPSGYVVQICWSVTPDSGKAGGGDRG